MIVFIDTSSLRAIGRRSAAWERLFRLSQMEHIVIYMSRISVEEYRSRERDRLVAAHRTAEQHIQRLLDNWQSNPTTETEPPPFTPDSLPSEDDYEQHSVRYAQSFVSENKIQVIEIDLDHAHRVWANYFNFSGPFNDIDNREDRKQRKQRRQDIPDAWIYEAARSVMEQHDEVQCICGDGDLKESLRRAGGSIVENLDEFLDHLEETFLDPLAQSTEVQDISDDSESFDETENAATTGQTSISDYMRASAGAEEQLKVRVMGYVYGFGEIGKDDLVGHLEQKGHEKGLAISVISILLSDNMILETANHIFPKNTEVCQQAYELIRAEVISMLEAI